MKIAILVSHLPPQWIGGTETQTSNLAKRLARNHEILVLTRSHPELPEKEKRDGYAIKRLRLINLPILVFITHVTSALIEIYKKRRDIDILQCMMLIPNGVIGIIAKKMFEIPTVAWVRGGDWYLSRDNVFKRIMIGMVLRHSNLILTQANTIKKDILCEYPNTKIKVVPNAVDTEHEKANGEGIIFVGNLVGRKGVNNLILAIAELQRRGYKNINTTIVGAGPEKEKLMNMAYGTGIKFIGGVPPEKVGEYIKKHSIFVLPSVKGEGLPNAILEAMSYGLPVIATKIAGIPDVVKHGETGFLVEPDNPTALADCILKLYTNNRLREDMTMKTVQEIKKYSWESVTNKLEAIYGDILKKYV